MMRPETTSFGMSASVTSAGTAQTYRAGFDPATRTRATPASSGTSYASITITHPPIGGKANQNRSDAGPADRIGAVNLRETFGGGKGE